MIPENIDSKENPMRDIHIPLGRGIRQVLRKLGVCVWKREDRKTEREKGEEGSIICATGS